MRGPANREEALNKFYELLSSLNKIHPRSYHLGFDSALAVSKSDWKIKVGKKVSYLVERWNLQDELAKHKKRDYVLVYLIKSSSENPFPIEPQNPRKLLRLAALYYRWHIVFEYADRLKLKDLTLLFVPLAMRTLNEVDGQRMMSIIADKFPIFGKREAKFVASYDILLTRFYPAVKHFGPLLYKWSHSFVNPVACYLELIQLGCPADGLSLSNAVKFRFRSTIQQLMELGAAPSDELLKEAKERYHHWWFLNQEELSEMFAQYGVDPESLDQAYPVGSIEYELRDWINLLLNPDPIEGWFASKRNFSRRFALCLPRIRRIEPDIAAQM